MSVTMRVVTKKPVDAVWWYLVEPEKAQLFKQFMNSQEGLESVVTTNVDGDANTLETILTFRDSECLGKYMVAAHSNPTVLSRNVYNNLNGIVMTFSYADQS